MGESILDLLAKASPEKQAEYLASLTDEELELVERGDWSVKARPEQLAPDGLWMVWLVRAGRGFGKTLCGANFSRDRIRKLEPHVSGPVRWALGGATNRDIKKTMIEGETGILTVFPPSELFKGNIDDAYNKTDLEIRLASGAIITGYGSETPERARGPQHHGGWFDEPASYKDAKLGLGEDTFMANMLFGMRLDPDPRICITGTPKNNKLIKELRALPGVHETHGRTRDNLHNLSALFKATIVSRYAGTRLGRQELDAEILDDVGLLISPSWFKREERCPFPADARTVSERYWDLASGVPNDSNPDPDWTVGAKVVLDLDTNLYWIEDVCRFRRSPGLREHRMAEVAQEDLRGGLRHHWMEKEPGNAGLVQYQMIGAKFEQVGMGLHANPATGDKVTRAEVLVNAAEQGRVYVPEGAVWLQDFLDECEEFPNGGHDDQVDAVAGAMSKLIVPGEIEGSYGYLIG